MSAQRFTLNLTPGKDGEETANRCLQELVRLTNLINQARIPITIGMNETLPEGMLPWQPVIDCRSGLSELKVWDGLQLI